MGNTASSSSCASSSSSGSNRQQKGCPLNTWAVAQYMSLSRDQLLDLRDACYALNHKGQPEKQFSSDFFLSQFQLHSALRGSGVAPMPDAEIIQDLYTLWDEDGSQRVSFQSFFVSLAPLACNAQDTLRTFFQFALELYDLFETACVTQQDLVTILTSLNATVKFFGDQSLPVISQQRVPNHRGGGDGDDDDHLITTIVSDMIESMTLIHHAQQERYHGRKISYARNFYAGQWSSRNKFLTHDDAVTMLAVEPWIRKLMTQKLAGGQQNRVKFAPTVLFDASCVSNPQPHTEDSVDSTSSCSQHHDGSSSSSTSALVSALVSADDDEGQHEELSSIGGLSSIISSTEEVSALSESQITVSSRSSASTYPLHKDLKLLVCPSGEGERDDESGQVQVPSQSDDDSSSVVEVTPNPSYHRHLHHRLSLSQDSNRNRQKIHLLSPRSILRPRMSRIFKPRFRQHQQVNPGFSLQTQVHVH